MTATAAPPLAERPQPLYSQSYNRYVYGNPINYTSSSNTGPFRFIPALPFATPRSEHAIEVEAGPPLSGVWNVLMYFGSLNRRAK